MCFAEKCCFLLKLELGCVMLGIGSLIFSLTMTTISAIIFATDYPETDDNVQMEHNLHILFETFVSRSCSKIVLCIIICMGVLLLLASVLLLIGITKKMPGFLLFYFGYGLFFTILSNIGALLLLLKSMWLTSVTIFIASLIYVHFLVVVHTVYDGMCRGKVYGFPCRRRTLDDDIAILEGSLQDDCQE